MPCCDIVVMQVWGLESTRQPLLEQGQRRERVLWVVLTPNRYFYLTASNTLHTSRIVFLSPVAVFNCTHTHTYHVSPSGLSPKQHCSPRRVKRDINLDTNIRTLVA